MVKTSQSTPNHNTDRKARIVYKNLRKCSKSLPGTPLQKVVRDFVIRFNTVSEQLDWIICFRIIWNKTKRDNNWMACLTSGSQDMWINTCLIYLKFATHFVSKEWYNHFGNQFHGFDTSQFPMAYQLDHDTNRVCSWLNAQRIFTSYKPETLNLIFFST